MKNNKSFWAVIPAAGIGKRMAADKPKQYLELQNKTVIEHCLQKLLDHPDITGAIVSLDENDSYWPVINFSHQKPVLTSVGGSERYDSVINALIALEKYLAREDLDQVWVLVHDAARPCVRPQDISKLIEMASFDDNGGLLACPVRDTMKRQQENHRVQTTIDRTGLWHALTPQMFKLKLLIKALINAREKGLQVTDDASAMELDGYMPLLVEGHEDNIKITRPFDLSLANLYLREQLIG
ncbi:MAG: 2-C-methyl-D-erythritol 4-phosphate cytidylyltransferase [Gammaproteobacteria bacterium]|nr:2-C-methyl-D-erythritol 4-phosphate cytidylyltransferase [Gammaproteobacteria bacterium]MDH5735745.1 2-C-methyl-D-erythritol 4-phosphate cytidylyltransferase [Gammaproteobacteria bacterium]